MTSYLFLPPFIVKRIRFDSPHSETPSILPNGRHIDASGCGSEYDKSFFAEDGQARPETENGSWRKKGFKLRGTMPDLTRLRLPSGFVINPVLFQGAGIFAPGSARASGGIQYFSK